jgi:hypothetical protein
MAPPTPPDVPFACNARALFPLVSQKFQKIVSLIQISARLPSNLYVTDNKNGLPNRSNRKRASYSCFMFIRETKRDDRLILIVENPKLRKATLGYLHLNRCKSVFHFTAPNSGV